MDSLKRWPRLALFIISAASLFLEMFLIRWNPACSTLVGYYSNLVLIACFLGLGIGMAGAGKTTGWFANFPVRFLLLNLVLGLFSRLGINPFLESWGQETWGVRLGMIPSFLVIPAVFILNTLVMIPLGRKIGALFQTMPALSAYLINLSGSLAGVICFSLINRVFPGPMIFAGLASAVYLAFACLEAPRKKQVVFTAGALAASMALIFWAKQDSFWSPYNKLRVVPYLKYYTTTTAGEGLKFPGAFVLEANDDFHQYGLDLSPAFLAKVKEQEPQAFPALAGMAAYYELPYRSAPNNSRVLILGAGCGNDVAAALRSNIMQIDAVEIDPVIAELGRNKHPEHPYLKPNVKLHITDARNFLKTSKDRYDLIVYGFLDSHTLFSSLSSVRLENFVYTEEGFAEAARHLSQDGMIVIAFATGTRFIRQRLFAMANQAFPGLAVSLYVNADPDAGSGYDLVLAGPGITHMPAGSFSQISGLSNQTGNMLKGPPVKIPTDNWPYLYLQKAGVGSDYAKTIIALLLIGFLFLKRSVPEFKSLSPSFFFLGAGFLFLETKAVTQLSLLFGSTWIVNSIVISGFLAMGIFSTALAFKTGPRRLKIFYPALFACLGFNYLFKWSLLLGLNEAAQIALASFLISLPVFFSGLIFAIYFKQAKNPAAALGSNLLGATFGGFSEYLTMVFGFKMLGLVAIAFYALALITAVKNKK